MQMGYNKNSSTLQDVEEMSHLRLLAASIRDKQSP
jgi:hypothetical protein